MSIEKINLRKLLQLFYASNRLQRALLLKDIRDDLSREIRDGGDGGDGGDFYGPFWADVKDHVAGRSNLINQTEIRIKANKSRTRLYPVLRDSFLSMWTEKMRWRNAPFSFVPESVKAHHLIKELGVIVKIENTAAVKVWDGSHRVIYPYFSEDPALPEEGARLGFWLLKKSLPIYEMEDFRIVDIQRRVYYRPSDTGIKGNEEQFFIQKYKSLLQIWNRLKYER